MTTSPEIEFLKKTFSGVHISMDDVDMIINL